MLVPVSPLSAAPPTRALPFPFAETPLVVAFAAHDDLDDVSANCRVALACAPDISAEDAYLLLPVRARADLVTAFARGSVGRVAQWFDEARVVRAEVDHGRAARLWVGTSWRVRDLLATERGRTVSLGSLGDPVRVINQLPYVAALAPGGLLDAAGTAMVTGRSTYVGVARRGVPALGLGADAVECTYVWTEREGNTTRVKVALAAPEDDSAMVLLTPLTLCHG